jgi:HSP20 family protein
MKNAVATQEETKHNGGITPVPVTEEPHIHSLQHEVNRLFDEFKHGFGMVRPTKWFEPMSQFHARVDIKDTAKELLVTAELPGVEMSDIEVTVTSQGLSIQGEKRAEKEEKEKGFYRMERSYGSFYRLLPLPCEVERENVKASFKDGVLSITLPKSKESLKDQHKIEVKAG